MTEQIGDQISAFIDDELSDDEGAFLVRRFESDATVRARALRYMTIGSALRGEMLAPDNGVLRRRVAAVLTGARVPVAARAPARRVSARYVNPLIGLGVAASVALVALGGLRVLNEVSSAADPGLAGQVQARWVEPASYTVPQESGARDETALGGLLPTSYLVQHGAYTSGLGRTSVNSNVVGGAGDSAVAQAARQEIGAKREDETDAKSVSVGAAVDAPVTGSRD